MNVWLIMDILAMAYILVGVVIGVLVYFAPDPSPEITEERAERIDETPSTSNALVSIVMGIIWPYAVFKVITDKKAQN